MGQDVNSFCMLRSCCVSAPLSHPAFFFASGVILELQAVLCDGQLGAVVYIISSAATCKLLRTGEEMKARSGSLFWRNVMADGSLPHNANCRLRLNRPRERDLSSDLIVCALTWRAKSVNIK